MPHDTSYWEVIHDLIHFTAAMAPVAVTGLSLVRYWLRCKRKAMREQASVIREHLKAFEAGVKAIEKKSEALETKLQVLNERLENFGMRAANLDVEMEHLREYVKRLVNLYENELRLARTLREEAIPGTGMAALKSKVKKGEK